MFSTLTKKISSSGRGEKNESTLSNLIVRNISALSYNRFILRKSNIINVINIRKFFENKRFPYSMHRLCTLYESLDYEIFENQLMLYDERIKGIPFLIKKFLLQWIIFFLIGLITALVASGISIIINILVAEKFKLLSKLIDENMEQDRLYIPLLMWICLNSVPVVFAACLICYIEPLAIGSGIPSVKCYLNGVAVTDFLKLRTLLVKLVSVTCSIVGGLSCGKEGPMVHVGASIGAGLADWKIKYRRKEVHLFKYFNAHREKREFVSAGAAAGLAAAFGGPVGGILFCLEDGASFWSQSLTFHTFFSAVVSTFTLNIVLSAFHGHASDFSNRGLVNLGHFDDFTYDLQEIPIFILMGIFGGCMGALWIFLNSLLQTYRKNYLEFTLIASVVESFFIASVTATTAFATVYLSTSCIPIGAATTAYPTKVHCGDGQMNVMASIWFKTPELAVKSFLHDPPNCYSTASLCTFVLIYYLLSCWTSGMAASMGMVVAGLLTGATWGRLFGHLYFYIRVSQIERYSIGKFALIGACAQLGGLIRTTISLTVIIMETTGNSNVGFPVVVTLMCAKWTAESFNRSMYDYLIMLSGIPFLLPEPPPYLSHIMACEIMSDTITTFYTIDTVKNVLEILKNTKHNGFPVVDPPTAKNKPRKLRGLILRKHLIIILKNKIFKEYMPDWHGVNIDDFNINTPHLSDISLTELEKKCSIDFRPFMNPSPYTTLYNCTLARLYYLFRALGLRHLPVVDDHYHVIGMITRKDIGKYRFYRNIRTMGVEELYMSNV